MVAGLLCQALEARPGETYVNLSERLGISLGDLRRSNPDIVARAPAANPVEICARRCTPSRIVGRAQAGRLVGGVRLTTDSTLHVRDPDRAWATCEVAQILQRAAREVARFHRDAPPLAVLDLSSRWGGPLPGHVSHQNGLDADLGLYVRRKGRLSAGLELATPTTLAVGPLRTLIEALVRSGRVEIIFLDQALADRLVLSARARRRVRHWPRHADHLHVRFAATKTEGAGPLETAGP